jgi:hypothetical protein
VNNLGEKGSVEIIDHLFIRNRFPQVMPRYAKEHYRKTLKGQGFGKLRA